MAGEGPRQGRKGRGDNNEIADGLFNKIDLRVVQIYAFPARQLDNKGEAIRTARSRQKAVPLRRICQGIDCKFEDAFRGCLVLHSRVGYAIL